jgi:hypothetical protein
MAGLQIYNARERALVAAADVALAPLGWMQPSRALSPSPVTRVLLLRLERIGDLLMVLDAIADARAAFPGAEIDLAVGSWNLDLARLIRGIHAIEVADVPVARARKRRRYLARASRESARMAGAPLRRCRQFRARHPE